ncbi:MAG TPA: proton-conducting transporter membrane subunit, partial [Chloroflexota bacterium]|nr:proton-conducting transporter membrane subunit [Chloroflexota bacterium]
MVLVVLADSVFAFLFAWEAMSLVSFFLVIHHHRQDQVRRAGYIYLVMTHASTGFLLAGFLALFAASGSLEFAALRASAASLPPLTRDIVFLAALVAFGTKAGVIPLHVWLPRAHPAAPSHVSALMSGVMIKMGIYGLIRVGWELAAPGPAWWGALVLALGCVSAVLGVLYALMEHDLKRLLAYHSVENIGIIMMGLGAALLLSALGYPGAAALGLLAGLYHVLNHAVFKALLFLGAGAVQQSAGTRDLEKLGGLIRRMPWTAATFLVGSAAISALPPLNGFVSEWLTFQSLLALSAAGPGLAVGAVVAVGLLALTGGLAAFCFVKAFGITFLGMPRSEKVGEAREVALSMRLAMVFLAAVCFALGLLPTFVAGLLAPVTMALVGAAPPPSLGLGLLAAPPQDGTLAPLALIGFLAVLFGLAMLLGRMIGGPGRSRVAPPWGCGIDLKPS